MTRSKPRQLRIKLFLPLAAHVYQFLPLPMAVLVLGLVRNLQLRTPRRFQLVLMGSGDVVVVVAAAVTSTRADPVRLLVLLLPRLRASIPGRAWCRRGRYRSEFLALAFWVLVPAALHPSRRTTRARRLSSTLAYSHRRLQRRTSGTIRRFSPRSPHLVFHPADHRLLSGSSTRARRRTWHQTPVTSPLPSLSPIQLQSLLATLLLILHLLLLPLIVPLFF